jgi:hypothetical protein
MCNQTVSLIAAELERRGIVTVVIQFLREITEKIRPPRALLVPFKHGYPLDLPNNPVRQRGVLEMALNMAAQTKSVPPVLTEFVP